MAAGLDDTAYVYEIRSSYGAYERRLVAYKNDTEVWTKQVEACDSASGAAKQAEIFYPTLGYDNTLYFLAYAPQGCTTHSNKLYAVSLIDGQIKFSTPITGTNPGQSAQFAHIFPMENGVAVLDGKLARFFDDTGTEDTAKTKTLTFSPNQQVVEAVGDNEGRIYAHLVPDSLATTPDPSNPNYTCAGDAEVAFLDSNTTLERVPVNDCTYKINRMAMAPNGALVTIGGQGGHYTNYDDMLVKYASSGSIMYETSLNQISSSFSGPTSIFPVADNAGNTIVISTASATSGYQDQHVIARKFDSTGSQSIVYTTEDIDTVGVYDKFSTSNTAGIMDGKVYLVTCKLPYSYYVSCNQHNQTSITTVDVSGLGSRYPQSEIMASYSNTTADTDEDGLTASQELAQGTSDIYKDSDGDGLSDLVESTSFIDRDETFCDTATTPYTCAYPDPVKKDVFVEVDWMVRNGTEVMKPTAIELQSVVDEFAENNINLYFDTGQFGGGNEVIYSFEVNLPSVTDASDLFDYKLGLEGIQSQFNVAERYKIWRYMLFGDSAKNEDGENLDGVAYTGDDDVVIAYGYIKNKINPLNFSGQLSKLIMHELGHNLCLSNTSRYAEQYEKCVVSKIDNDTATYPSNYPSVMLYGYLYDTAIGAHYSNGLGGIGDNPDWTAVMQGINDFQGNNFGDSEPSP